MQFDPFCSATVKHDTEQRPPCGNCSYFCAHAVPTLEAARHVARIVSRFLTETFRAFPQPIASSTLLGKARSLQAVVAAQLHAMPTMTQ